MGDHPAHRGCPSSFCSLPAIPKRSLFLCANHFPNKRFPLEFAEDSIFGSLAVLEKLLRIECLSSESHQLVSD